MPIWTIYHTPEIFNDEEKHQLAARIADHYEKAGLPRFYVVAVFHETRPQDFYVGGEPTSAGVRVLIDHIARTTTDTESRVRTTNWVKKILQPSMDRHEGLHWEFHLDETSAELWMINGLVPPPGGSDAEKAWAKANAASPY